MTRPLVPLFPHGCAAAVVDEGPSFVGREHAVDALRRYVEAALETMMPAIASPFANFMAPQMPDDA